jgi:hypothetical protein
MRASKSLVRRLVELDVDAIRVCRANAPDDSLLQI